MWHWDQGRLDYFQFDSLRRIADFVIRYDFRQASREQLQLETGLSFSVPPTYTPWRNYSRVLKLMLLVSERPGRAGAEATPVAALLAHPGGVTCDEYLHFIVRAFTEPSPALSDWAPTAAFRYPLLFSLKYLLAKAAIQPQARASLNELIGAYAQSGFDGGETDSDFIGILGRVAEYTARGQLVPANLSRQSRESLRVMAQISYLHVIGDDITVSLHPADAREVFQELSPIGGPRAGDRETEIRRLAALLRDGGGSIPFEYPNTTVDNVAESGFVEGTKVKRTHITIERNASLRRNFFAARPVRHCDLCRLDTAQTYPWTDRVLELHHLLPLSSGTRVEGSGTSFDDLVPVCPTCHRAVHRYYDTWLSVRSRADFVSREEARGVYHAVRSAFPGSHYAA